MANRRELKLIGETIRTQFVPLASNATQMSSNVRQRITQVGRERVKERVLRRLSIIDLATFDTPGFSLRSDLLNASGIVTLADATGRLNDIARIHGIGDVTMGRLQSLIDQALRPTPADLIIPNDTSTWSNLDFKYVGLLIQQDAIRRHLDETQALEMASRICQLAQLIHRETSWTARFTRGSLDRAQHYADELAKATNGQAIDTVSSHLELAIASVNEIEQSNHGVIAERWARSSASLQVLAEKFNPETTDGGIDQPAKVGETSFGIGAVQLLPEDFQKRIRDFNIQLDGFKTPLRGYQNFGAKFSLVGKGSILGDEMGLGKTMQALAMAHHLSSTLTIFHGLVIAPVSILENWRRETTRATELQCFLLHGDNRDEAVKEWEQNGGIGFTSYQTLRRLTIQTSTTINLMIVDEAHKVKNPDALQTQAVGNLLARSDHRLLLTGTPLENRTEEFIFLLKLANPNLGGQIATDFGDGASVHRTHAAEFRKAVAPAYLRRNQVDVLAELPELLVADEVVSLTPDEKLLYIAALASGNHAAVRQSVTIGLGSDSSKMQKLQDLLEEYSESGRKVIIYSFFLHVLDVICEVAGPKALRIDGSVPATERQSVVDEFAAQIGFAVLVLQIDVGGTGLNIQAASVVIIAEPQWKPSTEAQAVGRAHRMGQTQRVNLHRLIADNTIDERIDELLDAKQKIFDAVVRPSQIVIDMPEATESETASLNKIVAEETRRLAS